MKKMLKVCALLLFASMLVACQPVKKDSAESSEKGQKEGTVEIVIQVDGEEVDRKEVAFSKGQHQLEVLKENFNVKDDEGWVTSINGYEDTHQPVKEYWMFTLDGELSDVNADLHELKDGEVIIWNLAAEHE